MLPRNAASTANSAEPDGRSAVASYQNASPSGSKLPGTASGAPSCGRGPGMTQPAFEQRSSASPESSVNVCGSVVLGSFADGVSAACAGTATAVAATSAAAVVMIARARRLAPRARTWVLLNTCVALPGVCEPADIVARVARGR